MSWLDAVPFVLLLAGAGVALRAYRDGRESPVMEPILWRFFDFFGIHGIDVRLAAAVCLGAAGVGGLALDFIAHSHLGIGYPWWYGVVTAATGVGIGLVSTRALVGPADAGASPGEDDGHDGGGGAGTRSGDAGGADDAGAPAAAPEVPPALARTGPERPGEPPAGASHAE